jgi:hypothetical protein
VSRGALDVVSSRTIPHQVAVEYHPRVVGRACYGALDPGVNGLELAFADALAQRPEANALTLVTVDVESGAVRPNAWCFVVRGTPVRLK